MKENIKSNVVEQKEKLTPTQQRIKVIARAMKSLQAVQTGIKKSNQAGDYTKDSDTIIKRLNDAVMNCSIVISRLENPHETEASAYIGRLMAMEKDL